MILPPPTTIAIDGLVTQFHRQGRGPAMVLVHGLLGYSFSWRRVMEPFATHRQVLALDMPGSGFSDCHSQLDPRLSAAAGRLLKFLDALAIDACDLVGSSYGATTCLYLATKHPERIRTLTLVSPANPWSRIGRKRLALLSLPLVGHLFPPVARVIRPLHRISIRRMYGDPNRLTESTLQGYSLPLLRRGIFEHAVNIAQSWHADMQELEAVLSPAPPVPTLIIWGSKDRMVELASAEVLARLLKHSRLVVMDGAGHLPYEECPEEFVTLVSQFLAEHPPALGLDGK